MKKRDFYTSVAPGEAVHSLAPKRRMRVTRRPTADTRRTAAPEAAPAVERPVHFSIVAPTHVAIFLMLTVLVPVEFGFFVGPLFFTWSKLFLFVFTPVAFVLAASRLKLYAFDWVIIAHVVWSVFAFLVMFGPGEGLEMAGTFAIETLTVYLLVRLYVRTPQDVMGTLGLLLVLAAVAMALAVPEALSGRRYVHEFARSITGHWYNFSDETRLGMLRAASTFEHPILFGMFCAALLAPLWYATTGIVRIVCVGFIGLGTFFSLSSAPLLVFVAQAGLIVVERVTKWLKGRVKIISLGLLGMVVALELFTGRGAIGWVTMVMLNPATAWYRKAQIEYTMDDIMRHPLFGIGAETFTRPHWLSGSIDNHYIFLALRSGLPAVIFFLLACYLIWRVLARIDLATQPEAFARLRKGWGLMMAGLLLGAVTVTYFGRMQPLFFFYIAIGASLAAGAVARARQMAPAPLRRGRRAARRTARSPEAGDATSTSSSRQRRRHRFKA